MTIAEVLLADYDHEIEGTRKTLKLIPTDKADYKPHEKSMPMGRLAEHVARLAEFGSLVLADTDLDMATHKWPDFQFKDADQLLKHLNESSVTLKSTLSGMSDQALQKPWALKMGEQTIVSLPRYVAFRTMFLNHLVHHRAQLGVYLRLLNIPIPGLYGPSADEPFGGAKK